MNIQKGEQAATSLDAVAVIAIMAGHKEPVRAHQIGFYPSLDALAQKVRSGRNWSEGETFVCDLNDGRYVIMKQVAPASCEMMTFTQKGFHDVLTAYRYSQEDLVGDLLKYCGERPKDPVNDAERMQQINLELDEIEREGAEMAKGEAAPREIADLNVRRAKLQTERRGIVWRRTHSVSASAAPTRADAAVK